FGRTGRRHRRKQGEGLHRRDEAPQLLGLGGRPRRPQGAPRTGGHRGVRHSVEGVQGHPNGGPHGSPAGDHPEPGGRPGRPGAGDRSHQGSAPRAPGWRGPPPECGEATGAGGGLMASVDVRTRTDQTAGSVDLDDAVFGITPNQAVLHQVVTAQLAAARRGTQSTLTRAEVRGGGAKPWRQKGTGRARQGSSRSPHWAGGGVAMGPKPRDYTQKTPKKMVQLALRSALSDRAAEGKVAVVDRWDLAPKTRE